MNTTQPYGTSQHQGYIDSHQAHIAVAHPPSSAAPYSHYQQPIYQPLGSYPPHHQYAYSYPPHQVTSPQSATHHHHPHYPTQHMGLPAMTATPASATTHGGQGYQQQQQQQQHHTPDTTGQVAPPGVKPRVTATLWEDEGTLCFQVEVNGICVARREDNHMINGTKLLNVAAMTRGRRDGILKSEKNRNVVKIGPMHLKGVWIPFERALEFANKERITEQLYPLFVHNVGALLQKPTSENAPSVSRRIDGQTQSQSSQQQTQQQSQAGQQQQQTQQSQGQQQSQQPSHQPPPQQRMSQGSQHSTVSSQQHRQLTTPVSAQSTQTMTSQASSQRPNLDRAHTFPTPPVSASTGITYAATGHSYDYSSHSNTSMQQQPQPLGLDTGFSNARSMPTTPATTPPDNSLHTIHQQYQDQSYDSSRHVFSAPPPQQSPYGTTTTYHPSIQYVKSKDESGEQDTGYQSSATTYGDRYTYANPSDQSHDVSSIKGSPKHAGSGRATPRTVTSPQSTWQTNYVTPQRSQTLPSSTGMGYVTGDMRTGITNGMPSAYSNGIPSNKRVRDVDDDEPLPRPSSGGDPDSLKRRKTLRDDALGSMSTGTLNRPRAPMIQRQ